MKAYILVLALLISVSLVLIFVQTTPEGCDCQGIGKQYCLGAISCQETTNCIPLTCEQKEELLGEIDITQEESQIYTILIVDASKSMEGENLDATKRASKEFVQEMSEQEYLAVIEFNEDATLLSEFSSDKITLYNSIDLITPYGRTRFLEPFTLANNLFSTIPEDAKKYILFLSDGAPEDDQQLFLEQVSLLKEKQVNTYALAFVDKSNEELMKQIASKDSNLFLVDSATAIEEKFKEAYSNILEEGDLTLQIIDLSETYRKKESIQAQLFSLHNQEDLLAQNKYCPLEITSYLEAKQGNTFSRILGTIVGQTITFPLNSLDSGTYELIGHSRILLDECTLGVTQQFGNIQIAQEEDCEITCEDITFAMTGGKNNSYVSSREAITWNIFIDKSSSMNQNEHLAKAIQDTNKIITYIPSYEKASVLTFDNKIDPLYTHQQPRTIFTEEIESIVPSASTSLLTVLKKIVELENNSLTSNSQHIIMTDGAYGNQALSEINKTISQIKGCINTINYGTHLLTKNESAHKIITSNRHCGTDFITQPSNEELLILIGTNKTSQPEIRIQLQQEQKENQTTIYITPVSTFTGTMPVVQNQKCTLYPYTTIDLLENGEVIESISGSVITIDSNQSFRISSSFENTQCPFSQTKEIQRNTLQEKDSLLDIIAIIAFVLAINMLVFVFVLHRRVKKLAKIK